MYLNWVNAEFIINVTEAILCFSFLSLALNKKVGNKLLTGIIILMQAVFGQVLSIKVGPGNFFTLIAIAFMNFIIFDFIFDGAKIKKLFLILCYGVIVIFAETLTMAIFNFVFKIQIRSILSWGSARFTMGIVSRLCIYIILMYIKQYKIYKSKVKKIFIYELICLFTINIIYTFITYDIYEHYHPAEDSNLFSILTFGIVIFTILVIKIVEEIAKYSQKELEWNIRQKEYEQQLDYIKKMESLTYNMKAQRHDFNQHISCIYGLLDVDKQEEAKAYIAKLIKEVKEINYIANVGNPLVGAILNFKLSIAKEKDIKLYYNVDVPAVLPIDGLDLCILLGNALDNAIEACERLTDKYIILDIYTKGSYFVIKIINSKSDKIKVIEKNIISSKDDKDNHGFGLNNIKYVLEKYDGLFNIEDKIHEFELKIAVQNNNLN